MSEVTIAIARVQYPVTALGYGRRVGIWMQGCEIRCKGCIVPETWNATADHVVPLDALLATLEPWLVECDGITISGGEPCAQEFALVALLDALRARSRGDILLYSGYSAAVLKRRYAAVLARVDALIAEPFRADLPDDRAFIGSSNQRCLAFTALGRERYNDLSRYSKRIDIALESAGSAILLAGVPRRGELRALARALSAAGLPSETTHDAV